MHGKYLRKIQLPYLHFLLQSDHNSCEATAIVAESENASTATEPDAGQSETNAETERTETTEVITEDSTETSRGIKLGDSREQVIAAYGEPRNEVVYRSKAYNHDGLESQYNLCYCYIDERYPEVFFNLSFSMDQNDNVLDICYEAILMKWYK